MFHNKYLKSDLNFNYFTKIKNANNDRRGFNEGVVKGPQTKLPDNIAHSSQCNLQTA